MTIKDGDKRLELICQNILSEEGYKKIKPLVYQKKFTDSEVTFYFENRKLSSGGLAASCSIFFRYLPLTDVFGDSTHEQVHLNVPMDYIDKQAGIRKEWCYLTIQELDSFMPEISSSIKSTAFEFIAKNSAFSFFKNRMESESPSDWLTIDKTTRVLMFGACLWASGEKDKALSYLNSTLSKLEGSLPKYTMRIESLRDRLLSLV